MLPATSQLSLIETQKKVQNNRVFSIYAGRGRAPGTPYSRWAWTRACWQRLGCRGNWWRTPRGHAAGFYYRCVPDSNSNSNSNGISNLYSTRAVLVRAPRPQAALLVCESFRCVQTCRLQGLRYAFHKFLQYIGARFFFLRASAA